MATKVPIRNYSLTTIRDVLGETNIPIVNLRGSTLHKSINVAGNLADPKYCPGGDEVGRLNAIKQSTTNSGALHGAFWRNYGGDIVPPPPPMDEYTMLYNWMVTQPQVMIKYGDLFNWHSVKDSAAIKYGKLYNWHSVKPIPSSIKYGALYNWYAATDIRNIAAAGWHVMTRLERNARNVYCGGNSVSAGRLKETGFTHWSDPNVGATNEYGYNARGSARRGVIGAFNTTSITADFTAWLMDAGSEYIYADSMFYTTGSAQFYSYKLVGDISIVGQNFTKMGASIRLVKDSTTLLNGQVGTYTGNDGTIYNTICINDVEYLSENLCETKYRNNDWINGFNGGVYTAISDAVWSTLNSEAMCYHSDDINNAYYTKSISNTNAKVPSNIDWESLKTTIGGFWTGAEKLKDTNTQYWNDPIYANNSLKFNARGAGLRSTGGFYEQKDATYYWSSDVDPNRPNNYSFRYQITHDSNQLFQDQFNGWQANGLSLRLVITTPIEINGTNAIYVGNDGYRYKCLLIGGKWWLAENLIETKYSDGSLIPEILDDSFDTIGVGAVTKYDYLESNVMYTRKISSTGWRLPTWAEYNTLIINSGGYVTGGSSLKQAGGTSWTNNNIATGESGFNAVGHGARDAATINGTFGYIGQAGYLWTSEAQDATFAKSLYLTSNTIVAGNALNYKYMGSNFRLIKEDDIDPGYYEGNDGIIYNTVKIGNQVWTAENSIETMYSDGSLIPIITDGPSWHLNTSGAKCQYQLDQNNSVGYKQLINWVDWQVPSYAIWDETNTFLGGEAVAGGKLKEVGVINWNDPNIGATNEYEFNLKGSGRREVSGIFSDIKGNSFLWGNEILDSNDNAAVVTANANTTIHMLYGINIYHGCGIRLCNPNTTLLEGEVGTYTQNDGTILGTKVINGVEWLTENLKETLWNDGSPIKVITDDTQWSLTKKAARCVYGNNILS